MDSGFWIALFDAGDEHHPSAAEAWSLLQHDHRLVTSSFVVHETVTYLNCSLKNHRLALLFLDALDASSIVVIEVDQPMCQSALALLRRSSANRFSFTDCTSFIIMHKENLSTCAGFDQHFLKQGFSLTPRI